MRAGKVTHYEVDGKHVTATCTNAEYPRVYTIRFRDGPLLGYLQRSALNRIDAYPGSVVPDTMGAQRLGTYLTMREAVERIVREAS